MKIIALLAACVAGQLLADDSRVEALIQQGDACDGRRETKAALEYFLQAEVIAPRDVGVLLRVSKQYTDLIDTAKSKDDSKLFAGKALDYAKRAVALDANSAKAHLNLSICYGKMTDHVGNRTKMEYAKLIREEAQRSIDLDPSDDYAWHVLGRWHCGVAGLNGMLKALAGFMYGGLPPASHEEAVKCFRKAIEIAPTRMMHHAELAHAYRDSGQREKAAQHWQNVLGIRALDAQDQAYQKEARLALEAAKPPRGKSQKLGLRN